MRALDAARPRARPAPASATSPTNSPPHSPRDAADTNADDASKEPDDASEADDERAAKPVPLRGDAPVPDVTPEADRLLMGNTMKRNFRSKQLQVILNEKARIERERSTAAGDSPVEGNSGGGFAVAGGGFGAPSGTPAAARLDGMIGLEQRF